MEIHWVDNLKDVLELVLLPAPKKARNAENTEDHKT